MNDFLAFEPQVDGDATFRNFQRHNLGRAADHFGVEVTAMPSFGWRLRTVGAPAVGPHGACWLRVASEEPQWARGDAWNGNFDSNVIVGVAKPRVIGVYEWPERDWRNQRAELMTLLSGAPCSPTDALREPLELPAAWWDDLRRAIYTLRSVPTTRFEHRAAEPGRVRQIFGAKVADSLSLHQETVHGDLHWNNVLGPGFGLLDWEMWGVGPVGADAATLYLYSLLSPDAAARVWDTFAGVLISEAGRAALITVAARILHRADQGDYPDLAREVRHFVTPLLQLD